LITRERHPSESWDRVLQARSSLPGDPSLRWDDDVWSGDDGFGGWARRSVLAGALALPACATTTTTRPAFDTADLGGPRCLPPVKVSADRVIREVVGLRPYRASGFVVRREALGDKALVHNYGHGGGGITLSWGSARLAIDLGLPGHSGPVAVIGAGALGLATARLVQEAGYDVTVYAAALPPETTSNIAGGQWYPSSVFRDDRVTDAFRAQYARAALYSYRRFQIMTGDEYGIRWMRNYDLSRMARSGGVDADDPLATMLPEARALAEAEHGFGVPGAFQFDGMIVETPRFLRAMLRDVHVAGGRVAVRRFASPAEIAALPERLVFNCTGLGARDLFGDAELEPVRGQLVVLLPQPEVRYAYSAPGGLYMFSRDDGILLGGTFEHGATHLTPDPATTRRLLDGHARLAAGMRCA